jgi:photosystem II oxygen-evolving enhancer protein 1
MVGSDATSNTFNKFVAAPAVSMPRSRAPISAPPVIMSDSSAKPLAKVFDTPLKDLTSKALSAGAAAVIALSAGVGPAHAGPFTQNEINSLTYEQIKGTGLANTCPIVEQGGNGPIKTKSGSTFDKFCMEPTSFQVLEEKLTKAGVVSEAINTKVTTRQTYTLTGISGNLASADGKVQFQEKDGIDYAPSTVQLPGGERVPFLFTVKNLVATADKDGSDIAEGSTFTGTFKVPSYRTGLFLDPKGRGMVTGYDQAVALPALQASGGQDSISSGIGAENNKKWDQLNGQVQLKVTSVNNELGEIGGVFVHQQPSDTDMGAKTPKQLLLKGQWFATIG